nr:cytochrome P450 CYP749A22-like [Malus domestica]
MMGVTTVSSFLSLLFLILLALVKFFDKLWWTPTRIQKRMASQGIKGPSYKLIYGNGKEITSMTKETMSRPMSTSSHDISSYVLPHDHLWTNIYGKSFLQWYGPQPHLTIGEPESCKAILSNKDRICRKPKPPYFVKKLFGDGLLMAEGEKWVKLRKLATHAFNGESLKSMIPEMITSTEVMLERWKNHEGEEIEVNEEFKLLTSEVISRTAFGSSYLEGKNIFEMLTELASLLFKNTYTFRLPGISKFYKPSDEIKSDKLEKGIRDSIAGMASKREKKAMTGEGDGFGSDYLGLLLKAHHNAIGNERISMDELVDECKTFYLAGQETATSMLSWTVFLLALHTDWQEEARKEVLQLFGKQTPNPDGIAKLKLKTMSMIVNESLRLYPPVIHLIRETEKEVRLEELNVPANVQLRVSNLAFHHEPEFWGQDAQLFKPERFSKGVSKATNNNMVAFIPFGMGPRTCVGMNFAIIEAKIALSMILQRYSFTLSPSYMHSPINGLAVSPQHGVQVILHSL